MKYTFESSPDLGTYAGFVPNKHLPLYNWFYFKEGFSRGLVFEAAKMLGLRESVVVLDPFCGSGTTLLACKELGLESIGFDVLPSALLAGRVKTADYNADALPAIEKAARWLFSQKFEKPKTGNAPAIAKRVFSRHNMEDLIFLMDMLRFVEDYHAQDFLRLALINAAMKCSWAWKDGGVIKVRKHPSPPLRKFTRRVAGRMIKEAAKMRNTMQNATARAVVERGDARFLPLSAGSVDAVITSPPYLNQIDYTRVYAIENWIAGGEIEPPIRSFIGFGSIAKEEEYMPWLPPQASAYFKDMELALEELQRVCRSGAKLTLVVGNAYFPPPYAPVECDSMLAGLAEKAGFTVEKIIILNQRAALARRTEKVGVLRESMVVMGKS